MSQNDSEEKISNIIAIIIFFTVIAASIFIPRGMSIFLLVSFPYWMSITFRSSKIAIDITMIVVCLVFVVGIITMKGKIDDTGAILFFSLMTGYVLTKVILSEKKNLISNKNANG